MVVDDYLIHVHVNHYYVIRVFFVTNMCIFLCIKQETIFVYLVCLLVILHKFFNVFS